MSPRVVFAWSAVALAVATVAIAVRSAKPVLPRVLVSVAACAAAVAAALDAGEDHDGLFAIACLIALGALVPGLVLLKRRS
jgi:hypothetical protein